MYLKNIYNRIRVRFNKTIPDFIIVGAQKSGTSSLFSYLAQHPQINLPSTKEIHYFDYGYDNGQTGTITSLEGLNLSLILSQEKPLLLIFFILKLSKGLNKNYPM